ncbi:hypothetical protein H2200_007522 [Cladophialophora chaetospira]|uniref:Uncharacterized protein n=1 Tax=Cladophialophora chaetospira TaxID=386627 RepID=A0AA39CHJ6_9EURO|nr:hypothetical protein H2200_007522 [Cladophialophora chaetospira]
MPTTTLPEKEPRVSGAEVEVEVKKITPPVESEADETDGNAKDDGSEVEEVVTSLKNTTIQNDTEEEKREIPYGEIIESIHEVRVMTQFAPFFHFEDEPDTAGVNLSRHEKGARDATKTLHDRVRNGYQPLNIGFQDPIGNEIQALASLITIEGEATVHRENWLFQEVSNIVKRVDSASYQALVAFFDPGVDRTFNERDAKLCLEEIEKQWPHELQLSVDQVRLLHTAIEVSGVQVQYNEIKSFLRHICKMMGGEDMDETQLAELVKEYVASQRTEFPLFEPATCFSKFSEKDLVRLRYTLYKLPSLAEEVFKGLRESSMSLFDPCEQIPPALLQRKLRQCCPEDADLSPSARKLVTDIITVLGSKVKIESALGMVLTFRDSIFGKVWGTLPEGEFHSQVKVEFDEDETDDEEIEE